MKLEAEITSFLKNLGTNVRALRMKRGWTLEETESHGWPSWRHLQKIEGGKNITLVTLWKVCRLFKIDPAELFRRK